MRRFAAVISDCSMPDGRNWKDLLAELQIFPDPPPLIVTSRLADERLWAEVLNMGGYDLLLQPFDAKEGELSASLRSSEPGGRIQKQ
jgi:DNA-binding response OmpR family regulator